MLYDIQENYVADKVIKPDQYECERLQRELKRLQTRKNNLMDMRLDNLIDKEEYETKNNSIAERMKEVEKALSLIHHDKPDTEVVNVDEEIEKIKDYLHKTCDLEKKQVSENLINAVVARIVPTEQGVFKWYIQSETYDIETAFEETNYILYDIFKLTYEEAREYRKAFGNFIRARQWKDLTVEVYVRKD